MTVESLTILTDDELLVHVKTALSVSGTHLDSTLQSYIYEVKSYLTSAGVNGSVLNSTLAVGCIARGVADLWNYGNGDTKLSEYFYQRAEQLRSIKVAPLEKKGYVIESVERNRYAVDATTALLPIGIEGFNSNVDILELYVEGIKFDGNRYSIIDNSTIELSLGIAKGTAVEIVVLHLAEA